MNKIIRILGVPTVLFETSIKEEKFAIFLNKLIITLNNFEGMKAIFSEIKKLKAIIYPEKIKAANIGVTNKFEIKNISDILL